MRAPKQRITIEAGDEHDEVGVEAVAVQARRALVEAIAGGESYPAEVREELRNDWAD